VNLIHEEEYDLTTDPPLVVIRGFLLSHKDSKWSRKTTAVVDSGADMSMVPQRLVDEILKQVPTVSVRLDDAFGRKTRVTAVRLEYKFGNCRQGSVLFAVSDGTETLIGRDVLNGFHTTLDGKPCVAERPRISVSEADDAAPQTSAANSVTAPLAVRSRRRALTKHE
jgi:predicted aspartyl protease